MKKIMQEGERIKKVVGHYGSQVKLAETLGVRQSNVANWIKRDTIPSSAMRLIGERCPDISLDWLATGKGDMLIEAPKDKTVEIALKILSEKPRRGPRVRQAENGQIKVEFDDGSQFSPDAYRAAKKILEKHGLVLGRPGQTVKAVRKPGIGSICVEALLEETRKKKETQAIGKRKVNEILNDALEKCHSATKNEEGALSITPYNIEEGSYIAVVPVEKKAEVYIKVEGFGMSPTINDGDVIGIAPTDWFEQFSDAHIYMVELMTGEVLVRRIVPPSKESDLIRLVSDNPNDEERELYRRDVKDIKRVIYIGKNL